VTNTDEVVCITSQGKTIRVAADSISTMGRAAQGVRILNIERPDSLIGIDTVAKEDPEPKDDSDSVMTISGELDLVGSDEVNTGSLDEGIENPDVTNNEENEK